MFLYPYKITLEVVSLSSPKGNFKSKKVEYYSMDREQIFDRFENKDDPVDIIKAFLAELQQSNKLVTPTHIQQSIYDDVKLHKHHLKPVTKYLQSTGMIHEVPSSPKGKLIVHKNNLDNVIPQVDSDDDLNCPYCGKIDSETNDFENHLDTCVGEIE